MFLLSGAEALDASVSLPLERVGRSVLLGDRFDAPETRRIVVRRFGPLAAVVEPRGATVDVALILDDRDEVMDEAHADAWREWLRLSNALALRDWPTTITTVKRVGETAEIEPVGVVEQPTARNLPSNWAVAIDLAATGPERDLLLALAGRGGLIPPEVGFEGPEGIPLDLAWPDARVAVDVAELSTDDLDDLGRAGWHILPPDVDAIVRTLTEAGAGSSD
jgi:hypothetical protein